jgi:hypothetical protein
MKCLCRYVLAACVVIGFMQLPAARADSLPTFTATSAYAVIGGVYSWSITGNGVDLGGGGYGLALAYDVQPGSSLAPDLVVDDKLELGSFIGGQTGETDGGVVLNGQTDSVELLTPDLFVGFSAAGYTIPYGSSFSIPVPATLMGSGILAECIGPGLVPEFCNGSGLYYGHLDVANVNINIPGILTFYGSEVPGQGDTIADAVFTSIPEPVSGSFVAAGLVMLAGIVRRRSIKSSRYRAPLGQA